MPDLMTAARRFPETVSADPRRCARLATPQEPEALLITCSDSRVVPEALLGTGPGQVLELRNAGGIVPPYRPGHPGAEQATAEHAVGALVGRDVPAVRVPEVTGWLAPLPVPEDDDGPERRDGAAPLTVAVQQHVLNQVAALGTHPVVDGSVTVPPWFLDLTRGQVLRHDAAADAFVPL